MGYLVTIYNHNRERTKLLRFEFRHEAMSWLALSGFITDDMMHPYTGEYAEINKETEK